MRRHFGGKSELGARCEPGPAGRAVASSGSAHPTCEQSAGHVRPAALLTRPARPPQGAKSSAPEPPCGAAPAATGSVARAPAAPPRSTRSEGPSSTCRSSHTISADWANFSLIPFLQGAVLSCGCQPPTRREIRTRTEECEVPDHLGMSDTSRILLGGSGYAARRNRVERRGPRGRAVRVRSVGSAQHGEGNSARAIRSGNPRTSPAQ